MPWTNPFKLVSTEIQGHWYGNDVKRIETIHESKDLNVWNVTIRVDEYDKLTIICTKTLGMNRKEFECGTEYSKIQIRNTDERAPKFRSIYT